VERVFTFAAMATRMHPAHESRVFAAATNEENLEEMKRLELTVLEDGNIGGLNGVLLAAAASAGVQGACLLGDVPHIFAQGPLPKASMAILEAFATLAGIEIDMTELAEQSKIVEQQLGDILARVEQQYGEGESGEEDEDDEDGDQFAGSEVEEAPEIAPE